MDRQALVSVLAGVLGGLAGAALVLLVTQKEAALAREAVGQLRAEMEARLASVDHTMTQARREGAPHGGQALAQRAQVLQASAAVPASEPGPGEPLRMGSPAFEAAVLDIIERSDDASGAESRSVPDEVQRRRDGYWVDELSMRLGLSPAQTERALAIKTQLAQDLARVPRDTAGSHAQRESRRAARHAARQRADEQLRGVFTRQQVAAYEALDDELELYRQRDVD